MVSTVNFKKDATLNDISDVAVKLLVFAKEKDTGDISVGCTGLQPLFSELADAISGSIGVIDATVLPVAILILGYNVKSYRHMGVAFLNLICTLLLAFALLVPITFAVAINPFAPSIMMSLGIAVCFDYSLFMLARFREEIEVNRKSTEEAVLTMLIASGHVICLSGCTIFFTFALLLAFPQNFLQSVGWGCGAVVLTAMLSNMTISPCMLLAFKCLSRFDLFPSRSSCCCYIRDGEKISDRDHHHSDEAGHPAPHNLLDAHEQDDDDDEEKRDGDGDLKRNCAEMDSGRGRGRGSGSGSGSGINQKGKKEIAETKSNVGPTSVLQRFQKLYQKESGSEKSTFTSSIKNNKQNDLTSPPTTIKSSTFGDTNKYAQVIPKRNEEEDNNGGHQNGIPSTTMKIDNGGGKNDIAAAQLAATGEGTADVASNITVVRAPLEPKMMAAAAAVVDSGALPSPSAGGEAAGGKIAAGGEAAGGKTAAGIGAGGTDGMALYNKDNVNDHPAEYTKCERTYWFKIAFICTKYPWVVLAIASAIAIPLALQFAQMVSYNYT
jgi:hypothetical protein